MRENQGKVPQATRFMWRSITEKLFLIENANRLLVGYENTNTENDNLGKMKTSLLTDGAKWNRPKSNRSKNTPN